nr:ulp1 protease family, C-terminal catalytic domain-containing protein [Tanacetum cinerariifolium]
MAEIWKGSRFRDKKQNEKNAPEITNQKGQGTWWNEERNGKVQSHVWYELNSTSYGYWIQQLVSKRRVMQQKTAANTKYLCINIHIIKDDNELALVDPPKRKKTRSAKLKDKPTEPFKVEFDKNGHAIERDEKRDAQRDVERDAARDAEIEIKSENVEREASNEGILQKRRKQSSCELTTVVHGDKEKLKDIKEPKSCFLFLPYTEDTTPIAGGMVYPIGDEASSPLEDVRQAKKELGKNLIDFEHSVFRKQPCVKAAHLRWTTRDDDTADHIFEVTGGMIVGHEDTFHVRVSTEDIMKL